MTKPTLSIYVAHGCRGCCRALRIATVIERACPQVRTMVISLDEGVAVPPQVVGVPAYLLDGGVISLGNPDISILIETLNSRVEKDGR